MPSPADEVARVAIDIGGTGDHEVEAAVTVSSGTLEDIGEAVTIRVISKPIERVRMNKWVTDENGERWLVRYEAATPDDAFVEVGRTNARDVRF